MRNSKDVFHLAIPCKDVGETVEFYETIMGCKLSRRYNDRATFNFFGDQLVEKLKVYITPILIQKE